MTFVLGIIILILISLFLRFIISLFGRIIGKDINIRKKTGTINIQPFKTKKEIDKEDYQDRIIFKLNEFSKLVDYTKILGKEKEYINGIEIKNFNLFPDFEYELSSWNGRPILTKKAQLIFESGNTLKAINEYEILKQKINVKEINIAEFNEQIIKLYEECTK